MSFKAYNVKPRKVARRCRPLAWAIVARRTTGTMAVIPEGEMRDLKRNGERLLLRRREERQPLMLVEVPMSVPVMALVMGVRKPNPACCAWRRIVQAPDGVAWEGGRQAMRGYKRCRTEA